MVGIMKTEFDFETTIWLYDDGKSEENILHWVDL